MRLHFTSEFLGVAMDFRVAFSKRSWPYFVAVTLPWLIHEGQRSVRRLTHGAGLARHESSFYRFFSDFKFNVEMLFQLLAESIVSSFKLTELLVVVDDTLCPKWGHHIFGTASFFDHTARPRPGYIWGHNWVVLAIVVNLFGIPVAVPFWVALYRSSSSCPQEEFRTRLQLAEEAVRKLKEWTSLPFVLVADGAYNNRSLLRPLDQVAVPLVSRLRSDARLRKDPPTVRRRRRGRPPKYGPWLPTLKNLARASRGWQTVVAHIYGKNVTLNTKTFDAWWPKAGVKLRVVIVRDPSGRRRPCYLSSTALDMCAATIIEIFGKRWSIEQMFSDGKHAVGLDSAEVRNENSVIRHAALTFGFVTMVRIWAKRRFSRSKEPPLSFARQLSQLRQGVVAETIFEAQQNAARSRRNSQGLAGLFATKVPA